MITFFNDLDVTSDDPQIAASQYFGTKGFFDSYNARLDAPLTKAVQTAWDSAFKNLQRQTLDPMQIAVAVHAAESQESPSTNQTRGAFLQGLWKHLKP